MLSARGLEDSAAMGTVIAERGETPDLVLCSTSERTRQTWAQVRPALGGAPETRFLRALYEADDYLGILKAEGGEARSVLLIGHNPAMQETAALLASARESADGAELASSFPTAALAIFEHPGAWAELRPGTMRLVAFIRPERD